MKKVFAQTFPSGTIKAAVTSITLVNNTEKIQDVAVPSDTNWILQCIKCSNPDDVARVISIEIFKESAKTNRVITLTSQSRNAGAHLAWPNLEAGSVAVLSNPGYPLVLGAGMKISVTWAAGGASAGGTDADGLVLFYRELPLT